MPIQGAPAPLFSAGLPCSGQLVCCPGGPSPPPWMPVWAPPLGLWSLEGGGPESPGIPSARHAEGRVAPTGRESHRGMAPQAGLEAEARPSSAPVLSSGCSPAPCMNATFVFARPGRPLPGICRVGTLAPERGAWPCACCPPRPPTSGPGAPPGQVTAPGWVLGGNRITRFKVSSSLAFTGIFLGPCLRLPEG